MAGTREGGAKTAKVNKERYGQDYYKRIGSIGGKASNTGGFWYKKYVENDVEAVCEAGRKGGRISRRKDYGKAR